jgi:hypothetical protein
MIDIEFNPTYPSCTVAAVEQTILTAEVNGEFPFTKVRVEENFELATVDVTVQVDQAMAWRLDLTPPLAKRVVHNVLRSDCIPFGIQFNVNIEIDDTTAKAGAR